MSAKQELIMLSKTIKEAQPQRPLDVKIIIEDYFKGIHWSLLKDEWDIMSLRDKRNLYGKLYKAYRKGQLPLMPGSLHR